jgi:hypothetical protein
MKWIDRLFMVLNGPLQVAILLLALWEGAYVTAGAAGTLLGVLVFVHSLNFRLQEQAEEEARERSRKAQQRLAKALSLMMESDKPTLN